MNKETRYVLIGGAVLVLLIALGIALSSSDDQDADSRRTSDFLESFEEPAPSPLEADEAPQEAEEALGINLPSDARVATLIDGDAQTSVTGVTVLSISDTRVWLDAEIKAAGGSPSRNWNLMPGEGSSKQSATYVVDGNSWSVNLVEAEDGTQFTITRQN